MNKYQLLSKPAWRTFQQIESLHQLPLPALLAADEVWKQVIAAGTKQPTASDYAMWAQSAASPKTWLEQLNTAFKTILPSEVPNVSDAMALLSATCPPPQQPVPENPKPSAPWDPCQYTPNARARKVSVHPWELPDEWQAVLQRAAQGLPGKLAAAPSRDILERLCAKLCQLVWSAREAGLGPDCSTESVDQYLDDLDARLRQRPNGIRWATMRATAEELHRFARYSGLVSVEDTTYLSKRLTRYSLYEKGQTALKFHALLETGNTTLSLLDKADVLLLRATSEQKPSRRHLLRNAGGILGLYSIVPLRNADAQLILGDTLVWENGTWVIDTKITKTRARNTDHLVVALEQEFARYVDVVIQGDHDAHHLPKLRDQAMQRGASLFVRESGKHTSHTYIARLFKTFAGTSFTTTRTMLHTDQAINRGEVGTRDAMAMAHQTSPETAKKYQEKRIRQVAVQRVQAAAADRRTALLTDDLMQQIRTLKTAQEFHNEDF